MSALHGKKRSCRPYLVAILLLVVMFLSNCDPKAGTTSIQQPEQAISTTSLTSSDYLHIIYDDDGSPDGFAALMYLLSHPQVVLEATSISNGEAHPAIYIQHIGRVLESLGITDIPLGYGQDSPLTGTNAFPDVVKEQSNDFWGLPIPLAGNTYTVTPAPELMVELLNDSPVLLTLFVTGPFTNLAQALRLDPGILDKIQAVYFMGGAVYVPGNVADFYPDNPNKTAEWNIYVDPQAASEVFESGVPLTMIPLDSTDQVLISTQDTTRWRAGGAAADLAADFYVMIFINWNKQSEAIWDLMTAVLMLNPGLCTFTSLHLQVVTEEGSNIGQTTVVSGGAANVSVCLQPDAAGIRENLVDVFNGLIPSEGPTSSEEEEVISELAGTWTGKVGPYTFTYHLGSECLLNEVCGDFSIQELNLTGNVKLVSQDGHLYVIKSIDLSSGEPSCTTYESLELIPDHTLRYRSEGCEEGPADAILNKVGN